MKRSIRYLSFASAFALVLLAVVIFAMPVSAETEGLYTYTVSEGKATITDVDTSIAGEVEVPSKFGEYPVIRIESLAFKGCSAITSISIPDSVTSIGANAFSGLDNIITANGSVSYVDDWVIGCKKGSLVATIQDGTVGIAEKAFSGCGYMRLLNIPQSLKYINSNAFENCMSLTELNISDNVLFFGDNVFAGCSSELKLVCNQNSAAHNYAVNNNIQTDLTLVEAPAAPTVQSVTESIITLVPIAGYEYRTDDTDWQSSNVFEGLSANTEYRFYQRVAETDSNTASPSSTYFAQKTSDHDFAGGEWMSAGGYHFKVCKNCNAQDIDHKVSCSGGTATCTERAVCEVCKSEYGELSSHDIVWKSDAKGHSGECDCGYKGEKSAHEYRDDKICDVCGYEKASAPSRTMPETKNPIVYDDGEDGCVLSISGGVAISMISLIFGSAWILRKKD